MSGKVILFVIGGSALLWIASFNTLVIAKTYSIVKNTLKKSEK